MIGKSLNDPRGAIDGGHGYRATIRRIQEAIPAQLLIAGFHRWPIALATSSQFLVSQGRRSYGACRAVDAEAAVYAAYGLLGWSLPESHAEEGLIGSFVTPMRDAIRKVMDFLAERAEAICSRPATSREEVVSQLNAFASWVAIVIALNFAFRKRVIYQIRQNELQDGHSAHIDDKKVHEINGPAIPIAHFLRDALNMWFSYCRLIVMKLREFGDVDSLSLAGKIARRASVEDSFEGVFTVKAAAELEGVGSDTWQCNLPINMKLVKNFGRHFWPLQLMNSGIEQKLIDDLMRHQIESQHPCGSQNTKRPEDAYQRLLSAMNSVFSELALKAPKVAM